MLTLTPRANPTSHRVGVDARTVVYLTAKLGTKAPPHKFPDFPGNALLSRSTSSTPFLFLLYYCFISYHLTCCRCDGHAMRGCVACACIMYVLDMADTMMPLTMQTPPWKRTGHDILCAMSPIQTPSPLTTSTRHAFAIRPQGWLCKGSHVTSCHFAQPPGVATRRKNARTADCERVAESTFTFMR